MQNNELTKEPNIGVMSISKNRRSREFTAPLQELGTATAARALMKFKTPRHPKMQNNE
jgi:hypothetical protein